MVDAGGVAADAVTTVDAVDADADTDADAVACEEHLGGGGPSISAGWGHFE